ncbi:uncharacterized protein LOC135830757, partial [Sycon ciliatum]|uniref:uncharacterized protein LOC135830757 n=1 Tax=Sycon ciliatum TaxID=27933 RepID=UPI0031F61615
MDVIWLTNLGTRCTDSTGTNYQIYTDPFPEKTWKAANARCTSRGAKLFNLTDKNTSCFVDYLADMHDRLNIGQMWTDDEQSNPISTKRDSTFQEVTTSDPNLVVCLLAVSGRCGDLVAEFNEHSTQYISLREQAKKLCARRVLFDYWFHKSQCMFDFLQPLAAHYRFTEFWDYSSDVVTAIGRPALFYQQPTAYISSLIVCVEDVINRCTNGDNDCPKGTSTCVDTVGSYYCRCLDTYYGERCN